MGSFSERNDKSLEMEKDSDAFEPRLQGKKGKRRAKNSVLAVKERLLHGKGIREMGATITVFVSETKVGHQHSDVWSKR